MKKFLDFSNFRNDLLGGVTAGIVAVPLALAFGEQSGLGAAAGLYGAAFIAFFASLFGGTPTQISGPTAPMTAFSMVIVAGVAQAFEGRMEEALPIILFIFLLAGLFQILLGVLRLGTFVKYIPYTVVSGFMTGIGIMILITQLLPAFGYNPAHDEEVVQAMMPHAEELILDRILMEEAQDGIMVLEDFQETIKRAAFITEEDIRVEALLLAQNDGRGVYGALKYLPSALKQINFIELLLLLITVVVIYGFKKVTRLFPSTLIALLLVSGGAYLLGVDYLLISEIPTGLPSFQFEVITAFDLAAIAPYIVSAFLLALLGAIDSLLTSVVADNMTKTQHASNRELIGQGIGNSIAAFFGGLPGAGATIRTVVNIQAGGRTKISGLVAGLLLFGILIALGPIASQVPAAVLAGILITVGFGVMDYKGLKALPKMDFAEQVILIIVLLLTVFWQLVYAVAIGLVFASVLFLKRMSDLSARRVVVNTLREEEGEGPWEDEISIDENIRGHVIFKHLNGPMFFGIVNNFRNVISGLGDIHLLVIRLEMVPFIDHSGIYALEQAIEELHEQDVIVAISGANQNVLKSLVSMKVVPNLIADRFVFEKFQDCRIWLREILAKGEQGLKEELALLRELQD